MTIGGETIVLERLEVDGCCLLLLETEKDQMVIKNKPRKKMSFSVISNILCDFQREGYLPTDKASYRGAMAHLAS